MTVKRNDTDVCFRLAVDTDAAALGSLNAQLIKDEGHRNSMTIAELIQRMNGCLKGDYQAVVIEQADVIVGYGLFRREPDHVYLRQLFVQAENRRRGIGRSAIQWLAENICDEHSRIRIDVLVANEAARWFWSAIGFHEYCITMEMDRHTQPRRT